jgi:hypothetical protein
MSTHNNTVLDKETKRICLELIYSAGEEEGGSMRETATRLETRIGGAVGRKYLLELAGKLPTGLTNQDGRLTLRRAVNKQLGLDKLTPAERTAKYPGQQARRHQIGMGEDGLVSLYQNAGCQLSGNYAHELRARRRQRPRACAAAKEGGGGREVRRAL